MKDLLTAPSEPILEPGRIEMAPPSPRLWKRLLLSEYLVFLAFLFGLLFAWYRACAATSGWI